METATIITVPLEGSIKTSPAGYRKLVEFYHRCRTFYNCTVFIDLNTLYWIDANLSALLQAMIFKLNQENGLTFNIDVEFVSRKFPILFRNGLLSSLLPLPDNAGSTVEMQVFQPNEDLLFYDYITKKLLGHSKMSQHNQIEIVDKYLEVFSNVQKHARTNNPIFACGQFYPSDSKLCFTLVDLGIGFLTPIQEFTDGKISTSAQAIEWALKYSNSTKAYEETGGIGLTDLLRHCGQTGGEFNIITGDAYWGNNLGELGTRTVPEFTGTTIHLSYNCN